MDIGDLLLKYGSYPERLLRNIPRSAKATKDRIVEGVKAIPDQAKWIVDAGLGGLQHLAEMAPEGYRGVNPGFDTKNADLVAEVVPALARMGVETAKGGFQRAREQLPRSMQLNDLAPRYDTTLADAAGKAIVEGVESLPESITADPVGSALTAASFTNPRSWLPELKGAAAVAEAAAPARKAYDVAEDGEFLRVVPRDAEPQTVPAAAKASLPELRAMLANPETNPAFRVADDYTRETLGRPYDLNQPEPGTSLAKQGGIARVFDLAASGDDAYKKAIFERYGETMPQVVEQAKAQNYDQLTEAAYRQLEKEVGDQFRRLPVRTSYHSGAGEYAQPSAMLQDVMANGNLNVYRGGDRHDFLNNIDPNTGLNSNEQFRAVHDYFGHGTRGTTFRPGGEEAAYASHSQMLSPLAQMGLLPETRGQNSWVNYGTANAGVIREQNVIRAAQDRLREIDAEAAKMHPLWSGPYKDELMAEREQLLETLGGSASAGNAKLRELGSQYQYAPQSALLLPPEYLPADTAGGVPDYLQPLIKGANGTPEERALHFSTRGDLTRTDPEMFGTGHRGSEYNQVTTPRTYFYTGEPGTVTPEQSLFNAGPRTPYETQLGGLYPLDSDPDGILALANAYAPVVKRNGQTLRDLERLVQTYGYRGYKGGHGKRGAAAVFDPVDVTRIGDAISAPQPFAEGGAVEAAPALMIG